MAKLNDIPKNKRQKSDFVTNSLLLGLIILSPICCWSWTHTYYSRAILVMLNGLILSSLITCAHNYIHRRDNWRMLLFNLSGVSYKDFRVMHAMSHHLHPNTAHDLEFSSLEPYLLFLPYKDKSVWAQMAAFYYPIIFGVVFLVMTVQELVLSILKHEGKHLSWKNLITFALPTWMYFTGGLPLFTTISLWLMMMIIASFCYLLFSMTSGHRNHTNFFEGDVARDEKIDWGLYQLDITVERIEYAGNHFKSLTRLGDHLLHHLFPTLDSAELKYLYPILFEHCEKFNCQLKTTTFYEALISMSKQLARKQPNNYRVQENIISS